MLKIKSSLRLIQFEIIITGALISMPVMVPFYNSIGMNQGQIGLSQTIFTIAILALNIPTGWIADRFSRKFSNALGDFGCAVSLLFYSQATSFSQVVLCEILFGISLAFSQGADSALVKAHANLLDKSGDMLHKINSTNAIWRPFAQVVALTIGGAIGPGNARLAIAVSAIPFIFGWIISMFIREEGVRLVSQHKNPIRDIWRVVHETIVPNPKLRWLVFTYAIGTRITHVTIWALTPLMIAAGVPLRIIGIGWVLNAVSTTVGAYFAKRYAKRFKRWQRFAFPSIMVLIALSIMSINLSLFTIWLYAILGMTYGWNSAVLMPMLQEEIPDSNQATAVSVAGSFSQMLYAPLVWIAAVAGNTDIRYSLIITIIVFLPMVLITTKKLINLKCE